MRFITENGKGEAIAARLRAMGQRVTAFDGEGRDGPRSMLYVTCARRDLPELLAAARAVDPRLFYAVDRVAQSSRLPPLLHPTGWRMLFKLK